MVSMKARNLQMGDSGSVGCGLNEIRTHCSICRGMAWTIKENPLAFPFYASPGCFDMVYYPGEVSKCMCCP